MRRLVYWIVTHGFEKILVGRGEVSSGGFGAESRVQRGKRSEQRPSRPLKDLKLAPSVLHNVRKRSVQLFIAKEGVFLCVSFVRERRRLSRNF